MADDSTAREPAPDADPRAALRRLQEHRRSLEPKDERRHSLEGLRLGALLRQLEALQALQGLQELKPKRPDEAPAPIPADPAERARHRQWLRFKADWLEALLESTLRELEALESAEGAADAGAAPPPR
jgi:hypothetical protein